MARVNKLQAAERLILCGVEMYQRGEDPLAIHVVASSALNLLRELLGTKDTIYQLRVLQEGLFLLATARVKGEPLLFPKFEQLDPLLAKIVPAIASGKLISADQITINLDRAKTAAMLNDVFRPYNYLKHADRDASDLLDEDDVKSADALQHAILALSWIVPDKEWPESVYPFFAEMDIAAAPPA